MALDQFAVLADPRVPIKSINASTLLVGCAKLGERPGPATLRACWSAVEREGRGDPWAIANTVWALAVLEVSQPAALIICCRELIFAAL